MAKCAWGTKAVPREKVTGCDEAKAGSVDIQVIGLGLGPVALQRGLDLCHPGVICRGLGPYAPRARGPGFQAKTHAFQCLAADRCGGQPGHAGLIDAQLTMGAVVAFGEKAPHGSEAWLARKGKVQVHGVINRLIISDKCGTAHGSGPRPRAKDESK